MAKRLEQNFDAAVEASLAAVEEDQLESVLLAYLRDVHALEGQAVKLLEAGGLDLSAFFGAQPDSTTRLAGFAFAFEHLEVAAYELLQRVAARAGDEGVVVIAEEILAEERRAAERVAASWDRPDVPLGLAS